MARLCCAIFFLFFSVLANANEYTEVVCVLAPSQNEKVKEIAKLFASSTATRHVFLISNQLDIREHSSGQSILANSRGRYIPGTLSGATLTSRIITVGIVGLGIATVLELACIPENHPEVLTFIMQDDGYSDDFQNKIYAAVEKNGFVEESKFEKFTEQLKDLRYVTEDKFYEWMDESWYERTIRKTKRFFRD